MSNKLMQKRLKCKLMSARYRLKEAGWYAKLLYMHRTAEKIEQILEELNELIYRNNEYNNVAVVRGWEE